MGIVTKTGLVVLAVGVLAATAGFFFAGVGVPAGTGPNVGAALTLAASVPLAIVGAAISLVGLMVERKPHGAGRRE